MPLGPGLDALGGPAPVAQEELPEPVARAELVLLGRLAGPHEIPQRFVGRVRDPDWGEVAGPVAVGELGGVASVGLHPIPRLGRDEGGGDDVTVHPEFGQLPVEHVAAGARLITHPELLARAELPDQLGDGLGDVGDDPQGADFTARFRHGDGNGLGVDIQAQIAQVRRHWPAPFACSSAWFGSSDRVTYALRSRAGHSIVTSSERTGITGLGSVQRPSTHRRYLAAFRYAPGSR